MRERSLQKLLSFKSVQTKMLLAILLLIVIPMLSITYISFKNSEKFIQDKISQSHAQILRELGGSVNSTLEAMINASNMFTLDKQIIDILSEGWDQNPEVQYNHHRLVSEQMDKAKNTILQNFTPFICVFDNYGNMFASGTKRDTDNYEKYGKSDWLSETIELNGYMLWIAPQTDFVRTEETGTGPLITLSRLIKGSRSQGGYGVITISISEEEFRKKLLRQGDPGEELYITDQEGNIISHSNPVLVGENIKGYPYADKIFSGSQDSFIQKVDGSMKFISYASIGVTGWKVIKVSEYDTLFMDLLSNRNSNIFFIIMISVVFILVTALIIFSITQPLKKLQRTMKSVEEGNLDITLAVKGMDEVAQLGHGFNSMLRYINALIANIQEKQKKEEALRLEVMQAQINPHFLFNTLNTIKWTAIISQANNVASLIEALGRILEMSVKDIQALITLKDEVENLKSYLQLQKARYNQRFEEHIHIPAELENVKIPRLILQPLVENSIIHGLKEDKAGNIKIEIRAVKEGEDILLTVYDNGAGIEPQRLREILDDNRTDEYRNRFSRIGVQNVHKRVQLMFGEKYGLSIRSVRGEYTEVEVRMPLGREENKV